MKHASLETIKSIEQYLKKIRTYNKLKEKKEGIFYNKGSAFLHFHEDKELLFADLKINNEWKRFRVNNNQEWDYFLLELKNIFDKS